MNIIVTGASRGIGFQLVKAFVREGHAVVAIARNEEKLNVLLSECQKEVPEARVYPLSFDLALLSKGAKDSDFLELILKAIPSVDILVNNAGLLINQPFDKLTVQDFLETYTVNLFSIVSLIQLLLPIMGKNQLGHIVNISSMGGVQGSGKFPGLSAYSSSKSALNCLSECLAVELQNLNIRVNCLALGAVQTEMLAQAFPNFKAPLTAEQMAQFIAEFSLTGHRYFNGKIIPVSSSTP